MFYEVILGKGVFRLDTMLTYSFDGSLSPGMIVEVPVGKTLVAGVVYKKVAQPDFETKAIAKILYSEPLPSHLVTTMRWLADYYMVPISSVAGMILPNGVLKRRRGSRTKPNKAEHDNMAISRGAEDDPLRMQGIRTTEIRQQGNSSKTEHNKDFSEIQLNVYQKNAIKALQKAPGATKLLFGVTGSGKTNIYLHAASEALKSHKSTILLVPEIALTRQLVRVFSDFFGESVILIHSQQTEAERHRVFEEILMAKEPKIVIGPRSALFAPLKEIGLVIIDEEHEGTYYQENTPKYSAIRVASFMAGCLKCPLILGSATPDVADYFVAKQKDALITLTEKAKITATKPNILTVDLKERDSFTKNRYFSSVLLNSIKENLQNGWQTLIFHNRRGTSPMTICEKCGEEIICPNCFLPLTLHADTYELYCHTCGYQQKVPTNCPSCKGGNLVHKGFGTKLLENELKHLFPNAKIRRFDADNKKGEGLENMYEEVHAGAVDIIVGTQMLAKGLDLPKLATVGIAQADAGLALPDFSAEERTFQLITQVIGRVGRGHIKKSEVIIQTFRPEHPVIKFATNEDYEEFAKYLLSRRKIGQFPPFKYIAKIELTLKTEAVIFKKMQLAKKILETSADILVSPPMPAFHERTSRGYTWQIIARSKSRKELRSRLGQLDKSFRVTLDPPSLL